MQIALISSTKDPASVNIKARLLENFEFVKLEYRFDDNDVYGYLINDKDIRLYTIETPLVSTDNLDKKIKADAFIFLSKHRAEGGRASLTVHPIGNLGKITNGGKEKKLCINPSFLLKSILIELDNVAKDTDYEATLEATHHGPYMESPILFIELGSNESFWNDKKGALLLAKALMKALEKETKKYGAFFVIGGSHYSHVANKVLLKSDFSVSHICPKHNFPDLTDEMLKQAMEKSIPEAKSVMLDWKGLGKEKQKILDLLKSNNIKFERSDKFFE